MIKQYNFTNLNLQTISQQLSRIETQVQNLVKGEEKVIPSKKIPIQPVNIKPPINTPKFNFTYPRRDNEYVDLLTSKLTGLQLNMIKTKASEPIYDSEDDNIEKIFHDMQSEIELIKIGILKPIKILHM